MNEIIVTKHNENHYSLLIACTNPKVVLEFKEGSRKDAVDFPDYIKLKDLKELIKTMLDEVDELYQKRLEDGVMPYCSLETSIKMVFKYDE